MPWMPHTNYKIATPGLHVYELPSAIDTRKATNREDFPSWISQNNLHHLAEPITKIINAVLATGTFPARWKVSQVTPIKKVKAPKIYKDMRPFGKNY